MAGAEETFDRAAHRVGDTLRGKYRLERVLGVGGMAAVYAAVHRNGRPVALKLLHPEYTAVPEVRARFLREGVASNAVRHPGVVEVLDDDVTEDGSAFLVMELLKGSSLEQLSERAGPLPLSQACAHLLELLDVLVAAHKQGIIHRDIKPANLFLTEAGTLKVLDFGIARLMETNGTGMTRAGTTLGTPEFMAPEQALGRTDEVGAPTDLWAAAATFWFLVTGRCVHEAASQQEALILAATRSAPKLHDVASHVPPAVAAVIDRALSFERSDRWQSAEDMHQAMRRALLQTGLSSSAGRTLLESDLPAQAASVGGTTIRSVRSDVRRWLALGALILVAVVALLLLRTPEQVDSAAVSSSPGVSDVSPLAAPVVSPVASTSAVASAESRPPSVYPAPSTTPVTPTSSDSAPQSVWSKRPASPRTPAPKAKKDNCSPPYLIDSRGIKVWKRECF